MSSQDGTIPVGFRVTKQQRDELQRWVSYFASQRSIDLELVDIILLKKSWSVGKY